MHFRHLIILVICTFLAVSFNCTSNLKATSHDNITKAVFHLSAFGVESDGFPTIDAEIDFSKRNSLCQVTYYDPKYKPRSYRLSEKEIDTLSNLINSIDWRSFKKEFTVAKTDQPTSTLAIKIKGDSYEVKDYGLEGDNPLPELYRIVYKLDQNFR